MGKEMTAMDNALEDIADFEYESEQANDVFIDNSDKTQKGSLEETTRKK